MRSKQVLIFVGWLLILGFSAAQAQSPEAPTVSQFVVDPSSLQVDTDADYSITFDLVGLDLTQLDRGEILLTFPAALKLPNPAVVQLSHSEAPVNLVLAETYSSLDTLRLTLRADKSTSGVATFAPDDTVRFTLAVHRLHNPEVVSAMHLGLTFCDSTRAMLCGWHQSASFQLTAGPFVAIAVEPSENTSVRAGDTLGLLATGQDAYGNPVGAMNYRWRFSDDSDPIGRLIDNRLVLTTVGQATLVVEAGGVVGYSGRIQVSPGALSQIVLAISPQQVVNHHFYNTAQIFLLDENSNLVTDYDLAADPIFLTPVQGSLTPSVLNDTMLFSDGVVNFLPANVKYSGPTGSVEIIASNSTTASLGVFVSFSGYDIQGAADLFGNPVTTVYSNLITEIRVRVNNGGDQHAIQNPTLKAFFASGGGSVQRFITPKANNDEDTVLISLPTAFLPLGTDTLKLVLESRYRLNGDVLPVFDTLRIPLQVLSSVQFTLTDDSFSPDSVYADRAFDLSFDVLAAGFTGLITGSNLTVRLLDDDDSTVATLIDGPVWSTGLSGDTIKYDGIQLQIGSAQVDTARWYQLKVDYQLFSQGNIFSLSHVPVDSIYILPIKSMTYVSGTFLPTSVGAGQEASFAFDVNLGGSTVLDFLSSGSSFQIIGDGFSTTTNLVAIGDSLVPGVNRLQSSRVFVPEDQLGDSLIVRATVQYAHRGAGNHLAFQTSFSNLKLPVRELPLVRIVEVSLMSLNSPKVNTGQEFQICCKIANMSTSDQGEFELQMTSDGASVFDSSLTVDGVPAEDTTEVCYQVTAASVPNPSEIFRIDIASSGVNQLPPKDNLAIASVQRPALLDLSHVLIGAENGFVDVSQTFSVILNLQNNGDADASSAVVEISSHGIPLGHTDPFTEVLPADNPVGVSFTAPDYDTTLALTFTVIDRPIDLNTGLPAAISDTTFAINLAVVTPDVEMIAEADGESANVVWPGGEKALFLLRLISQGLSSVTDTKLESIELFVKDQSDQPIDVRTVMEVGSAGFYDGDVRVARATAGADRLSLIFDNYVITAGDTVQLVFRARTKAEAGHEFRMVLDVSDIRVTFASGPLAGEAVTVMGSSGSENLLDEVYTAVNTSLDGSFIIRDNPFDPTKREAEFQYYLTEESAIEFRILTLSGELVYSVDLPEGAAGASTGQHSLFWDGRNDEGHLVLNGVYLAVIRATDSDQDARLKVAVLK